MREQSSKQVSVLVIDREGAEHSVQWEPGQSLMELLRDNGLPVLASCGGVCACATCHIYIEESRRGSLGMRNNEEDELLSAAGGFRPEASRLACQIPYDEHLNGMTVTLAPE
jgi:2Fe-2S ferredoxin